MRIARINKTFTNSQRHHPLVNIEIWETVPPDDGDFTFRQVDYLDENANPSDQNLYQYPVGPSDSVDLYQSGPDIYYSMYGNVINLQAVPKP
jgi:hypothetical protein